MEADIVLALGLVFLGCGSLSMFVVRWYSRGLLGIGWLSGSFAVGSLGAGLAMMSRPARMGIMGADLALLISFGLLHLAVLEVSRGAKPPVWLACGTLSLQAVMEGLQIAGWSDDRPRITCLGLLIAVQALATARVLWVLSRRSVRAPAVYSCILLLVLAAFSLVRSTITWFGLLPPRGSAVLSLAAFALFISVALGLAFGFFWMTTAMLTTEIEHVASTDPLTRVYNRRVFLRWCEKELLRTQRSGAPFSLLMIDLDHFKRINDNFGHQRGDEVLCAAVERMQDSVRGIDVLCRWGGEEFAVLLPNAPAESTRIVAERIRVNIHRMKVALDELSADGLTFPHLTASIGAATYRDLDDDIAAMLLRADRALYRAKGAGRNQVLIAG